MYISVAYVAPQLGNSGNRLGDVPGHVFPVTFNPTEVAALEMNDGCANALEGEEGMHMSHLIEKLIEATVPSLIIAIFNRFLNRQVASTPREQPSRRST
jgi:hypothetical protein